MENSTKLQSFSTIRHSTSCLPAPWWLLAISRLATLTITLLLLNGCASLLIPVKDGDKLSNGHGYILLGMETNRPLYRVRIAGMQSGYLDSSDLPYGSYHLLIELPAGKYRMDRVYPQKHIYYQLESADWSFEITEGEINYVGDLHMRSVGWRNPRARFELANRSSSALEFLEKYFAETLATKSLRYAGPGEDAFFELANSIKASRADKR